MSEFLTWWYKSLAAFYGLFGIEKKVVVPFGCFAAVFKSEREELKLLMVQHNYGQGLYSLPGGGLAYIGEPPPKAAERETEEESGLKVQAQRLIAHLSLQKSVGIVSLFLAQMLDPKAQARIVNSGEIKTVMFLTWPEIQAFYDQGLIYKAQYKLAKLAFHTGSQVTVFEWPKDL